MQGDGFSKNRIKKNSLLKIHRFYPLKAENVFNIGDFNF